MSRPAIAALTPDIPDETMLTTRDVASVLVIGRTTATELLATGKISGAVRVGTQYRIAAGTLRQWLRDEQLPKNRALYELYKNLRRQAS